MAGQRTVLDVVAVFVLSITAVLTGDNYSLLTVLFALVLFLTAMSQRKISLKTAWALLALGGVVAIVGLSIMLTFPIDI